MGSKRKIFAAVLAALYGVSGYALQSASTGILGGARAQYHLRQIMVFLDALVFNKPEVFVTMAKSKLDEGTRALTDEPTREVIRQQLAAFSSFIAKVGGPA